MAPAIDNTMIGLILNALTPTGSAGRPGDGTGYAGGDAGDAHPAEHHRVDRCRSRDGDPYPDIRVYHRFQRGLAVHWGSPPQAAPPSR